MRERRYWYLGALILLVTGLFLAWLDPFATNYCGASNHTAFTPCDSPGRNHAWGVVFGLTGVLGSLILVAVGTLRDPPD